MYSGWLRTLFIKQYDIRVNMPNLMAFSKKNFFLSFFTVLLAISVPRLALFISLFGALCLSVLGIAFPALMEICVLYPDNWGRCGIVVIRNVILIVIGLFGLVTGTHKSVVDIIVSFQPTVESTLNGTIQILTTSTEPNSL